MDPEAVRILWAMGQDLPDVGQAHLQVAGVCAQRTCLLQPRFEACAIDASVWGCPGRGAPFGQELNGPLGRVLRPTARGFDFLSDLQAIFLSNPG